MPLNYDEGLRSAWARLWLALLGRDFANGTVSSNEQTIPSVDSISFGKSSKLSTPLMRPQRGWSRHNRVAAVQY